MLTQYLLNNVRRIGKSDYKPTENDIKMINQYYPENVKFKDNEHKRLYQFYNCELNSSKWSQITEIRWITWIVFMIDLTSYHRTIINPNTNNQINEMQLTLDNFERIFRIPYIFLISLCVACFFVFVLFFFLCVFFSESNKNNLL